MNNIQEIHEKVFHVLMEKHKKDPNNFFFTVRQTNRSGRLDKGYWFLGNENYLAVSFWDGRDWKNRTPNLYFQINKGGETSFIFSAKDNSDKLNFAKRLQPTLENEIKSYFENYKNNSSEQVLIYNLGDGDYLRDLETFIRHIKPIIDNAVWKKDNDYEAYLQDMQEINKRDDIMGTQEIEEINEGPYPIRFIDPFNFNKYIKKIHNYFIKRTDRTKLFPSLEGFTIKQFGPIEYCSLNGIPKETRWIFLTGENGCGKTSILKAIAAGLCQNNDYGEIIEANNIFTPFDISISYYNEAEYVNKATVALKKNITNEKKLIPKGLATYGPVRLISEGYKDGIYFKEDIDIILKKKTYNLFHIIGLLKDLSNDNVFTNSKFKEISLLEDALIANLEEIIPNIGYIEKDHALLFHQKDENGELLPAVQYDRLPSGTKNFVGIIMDMLIRFNHQQPQINDPGDYSGIVIIDEIDIHLHPKMQKEIIQQLADTFPNIQFIVATHSPIPILGAPENSVFLKVSRTKEDGIQIQRLDDKILMEELLPNTLLTSPIFGMEDIFPKIFSGEKLPRTEISYDDIKLNNLIDQRIKNFFDDSKEQALIKRIKERRGQ